MKTQISRDNTRPEKRYSGVYQQQGRMITDADWNELNELVKRRLDDALGDVVASGVPRESGLVVQQANPGDPLLIQAGHLYADGVAAQAVAAAPGAAAFGLDGQADFPTTELPSAAPSGYKVYADVWERTVLALEDDGLLDAALHGADTCTRTQTMAQLKWCDAGLDPEDPAVNPPIGDARLTLELRAKGSAADPCDPCADQVAVDARTGNYLFRVEVHDVVHDVPQDTTTLTLKWSRENGAEQHLLDPEPTAEFKSGHWVYEFSNDATEKHLGVHLDGGVTAARGLLMESYPDPLPAGYDRVRRWDGYCVLVRNGGTWSLSAGSDVGTALVTVAGPPNVHGEVELGDDLRIQLENLALTLTLRTSGTEHVFVAGDSWMAAIREAAHAVGDTVLTAVEPAGVVHHYLRLAEVDAGGVLVAEATDQLQRLAFPSLSDLRAGDVDYAANCPSGLFDAGHDTVQKALDRVCELAAEHVAFTNTDPNCTVLAGATNVKEALDALCAREGCRVTVGPNGEFATLQAAITTLVARGDTDLCLCLLHGDHVHSGELLVDKPSGFTHLNVSIHGCGAGSRLSLSDGTLRFAGLDSVDLRDLDLNLAEDGFLVFDASRHVTLDSVLISGPERSQAPVEVRGAESVHLERNDVDITGAQPALALVLETTTGKTTLVDNRVQGIVGLHGAPDPGVSYPDLTDLADALASVTKITDAFTQVGGSLSMTRNELSRLVLGEPMVAALTTFVDEGVPIPGAFRALFLTNNRFVTEFNRFLAQDCRLSSNVFEGADRDLAQVFGMTGIYVGNHSDSTIGEIVAGTARDNSTTRADLNTLILLDP